MIFKDHFQDPISAIVEADYRLDGKTEIICCSNNGSVRGYLPAENELRNKISSQEEEIALRELNERKQVHHQYSKAKR